MPRRLTRAEAKARTRAQLLDAAAAVFARKGFDGASVEEIADRAGYSTGALYSNFSGKRELFVELMRQRARARIDEAARILRDEPDRPLAHSALGRQLVEIADKDVEAAELNAEFWLYAVRHPDALPLLARLRRDRDAAVARLIRDRHPAGPAPHDPERIARAATVVGALFEGLVRLRRIDPDRVDPELYGEALDWLFTGLAAHAPDAPPATPPDAPPAGPSAPPDDPLAGPSEPSCDPRAGASGRVPTPVEEP